jgi:hypothetical protein
MYLMEDFKKLGFGHLLMISFQSWKREEILSEKYSHRDV